MEDQTLLSRGGANSSSPGTPSEPAFGPGARSLEAEARSFEGEAEARSIEAEAEARSFEAEAEARSFEAEAEARSIEGEAEARSFEAEEEARSIEAEAEPPPRPMEVAAAKGAWLTSTGSGSRSFGLW